MISPKESLVQVVGAPLRLSLMSLVRVNVAVPCPAPPAAALLGDVRAGVDVTGAAADVVSTGVVVCDPPPEPLLEHAATSPIAATSGTTMPVRPTTSMV